MLKPLTKSQVFLPPSLRGALVHSSFVRGWYNPAGLELRHELVLAMSFKISKCLSCHVLRIIPWQLCHGFVWRFGGACQFHPISSILEVLSLSSRHPKSPRWGDFQKSCICSEFLGQIDWCKQILAWLWHWKETLFFKTCFKVSVEKNVLGFRKKSGSHGCTLFSGFDLKHFAGFGFRGCVA